MTAYRRCKWGRRGRLLESINVSGRKCMNVEVLQRFVDAHGGQNAPETSSRQTKRRRAEIAKADGDLVALGV